MYTHLGLSFLLNEDDSFDYYYYFFFLLLFPSMIVSELSDGFSFLLAATCGSEGRGSQEDFAPPPQPPTLPDANNTVLQGRTCPTSGTIQ